MLLEWTESFSVYDSEGKNAMKEKPNVVSASPAQKIIPSNYFNVLNETLYSHLPV